MRQPFLPRAFAFAYALISLQAGCANEATPPPTELPPPPVTPPRPPTPVPPSQAAACGCLSSDAQFAFGVELGGDARIYDVDADMALDYLYAEAPPRGDGAHFRMAFASGKTLTVHLASSYGVAVAPVQLDGDAAWEWAFTEGWANRVTLFDDVDAANGQLLDGGAALATITAERDPGGLAILFGYQVEALDVDGDGITDLAISAPAEAETFCSGTEAVRMYRGPFAGALDADADAWHQIPMSIGSCGGAYMSTCGQADTLFIGLGKWNEATATAEAWGNEYRYDAATNAFAVTENLCE